MKEAAELSGVDRDKRHEAGKALGCSVRRRRSYLLKKWKVDSREAVQCVSQFLARWPSACYGWRVGSFFPSKGLTSVCSAWLEISKIISWRPGRPGII